jgi:peroxiredoxin
MRKSITSLGLLILGLALHPAFAQAPKVGDLAPDFILEQLDGNLVSLSDFRGQVVYINFFGYS